MSMQIQIRILLASVFLLWKQVESIRFQLESGHTRCIAEEIMGHVMTVGSYHIVNSRPCHPLPDTHRINVRVKSKYGRSYHQSDNTTSGYFAYETVEADEYTACFSVARSKPPVTITIEFDWKSGVVAKDWTNVAKKGSVDMMELQLKKMLDMIQSIHDEMFYLRDREEELRRLNISTKFKMAWLTFLSPIISFTVVALQLWYLKKFFQRKKLL